MRLLPHFILVAVEITYQLFDYERSSSAFFITNATLFNNDNCIHISPVATLSFWNEILSYDAPVASYRRAYAYGIVHEAFSLISSPSLDTLFSLYSFSSLFTLEMFQPIFRLCLRTPHSF